MKTLKSQDYQKKYLPLPEEGRIGDASTADIMSELPQHGVKLSGLQSLKLRIKQSEAESPTHLSISQGFQGDNSPMRSFYQVSQVGFQEKPQIVQQIKNNALRPSSDFWYPGLSDFKNQISSDFADRYNLRMKQKQQENNKKAKRVTTQMGTRKSLRVCPDHPKQTYNFSPLSQEKATGGDVKQLYITARSSSVAKEAKESYVQSAKNSESIQLPFTLDYNKSHLYSLRDQEDRETYEISQHPITKRSKFKLFQNLQNPQRAPPVQAFISRDGSTSQNNYRFRKFKNEKNKSYYGSSNVAAGDILLPSNEKQGGNKFWPYAPKDETEQSDASPQYKTKTGKRSHEIEAQLQRQYQLDLVSMLKQQVLDKRDVAMSNKNRHQKHLSGLSNNSGKGEDTFGSFFENFGVEEAQKHIKKVEQVDVQFLNQCFQVSRQISINLFSLHLALHQSSQRVALKIQQKLLQSSQRFVVLLGGTRTWDMRQGLLADRPHLQIVSELDTS